MPRQYPGWFAALAVSLTALGVAGAARAADKPVAALERKEMDLRIYEMLREVIDIGADLYNGDPPGKGLIPDPGGCYQLYRGALLGLRPLLDHHADLQKAIDAGLAKAEKEKENPRRAWELRLVINEVRAKVKLKEAQPAATLWERLGGEKKVGEIVDAFVAGAVLDPKVNFYRGDKFKDKVDVPKLKKLLVEMISSVSDGPYKYSGRGMKEVHAGMGISDAEFDAVAGHLIKALEKNGAKREDVETVLKAVSGTRKDIVEPKKPMDKEPEKKPAGKEAVSGTVTLDGKPLDNATVVLTPEKNAGTESSSGKTDVTGRFEVKGLKEGKYQIAITTVDPKAPAKDPPAKELLPAQYNAKTTLTLEVKRGDNVANFDLTSK